MQTMHNDTLGSLQKRSELLKRAERLLDGNVACVCINRAESEANRESVMRISIQSAAFSETAKILSLVLPCMRKKKIAGVVPSGLMEMDQCK